RGDLRVRVRRAQNDHPGLVRENAIVAVEALAGEQAVVLQALLRARGAEPGGRGIELRGGCVHGRKKASSLQRLMLSSPGHGEIPSRVKRHWLSLAGSAARGGVHRRRRSGL